MTIIFEIDYNCACELPEFCSFIVDLQMSAILRHTVMWKLDTCTHLRETLPVQKKIALNALQMVQNTHATIVFVQSRTFA